jgi:hypothetical protein
MTSTARPGAYGLQGVGGAFGVGRWIGPGDRGLGQQEPAARLDVHDGRRPILALDHVFQHGLVIGFGTQQGLGCRQGALGAAAGFETAFRGPIHLADRTFQHAAQFGVHVAADLGARIG